MFLKVEMKGKKSLHTTGSLCSIHLCVFFSSTDTAITLKRVGLCCWHWTPHICQGNCSLSVPMFSVISLWGTKGELGYEGRPQHHREYCIGAHFSATRCSSAQFCLNGDSTQLAGNRAALHRGVHTRYEPKHRPGHFKCSSLSLSSKFSSLILLLCYGTKLEAVSISIYLNNTMEYLTGEKDIFNLVP